MKGRFIHLYNGRNQKLVPGWGGGGGGASVQAQLIKTSDNVFQYSTYFSGGVQFFYSKGH